MKTLIWVVFGLFAGLGTGAVAVVAEITGSLIQAVASAPVGDLASAAHAWTAPPWMGLWLDPVWVESIQAAGVVTLSGLSTHLPSLSGWMDWLVLAIWMVWWVLVVMVLMVALVLHWLAGRAAAPSLGRPVNM